MSLETATYINDLVPANPVPADPKSQGDDHLRLLKATIKQTLNGFTGSILLTATDTGTAAAHVLTPATALAGYTPMLCLLYQPAVTNTGAITVNVSGLGAKSIKTLAGADPTAGDIVAGAPVLLMYNGTNFINLAGSEFISKTGNQTLTGNLTLTGGQTVGGALAVTGATTLPANTSIGAVSAAEIAFVDGVTSPMQPQIDAKGAISGQAWMGAQDFTGATPTGPTPTAGDTSAKFATTAFAAALAFQAALPAQAGNAGKFVTTNGSAASWVAVPPPSVIRSARTANTILGAADRTTLIDITSGTFTQTFAAATTLGNGWSCYLRNSGAGDITLDPNAAELIDGLGTYVMYPGEVRLVQCDGAALRSVVLVGFYKTFTNSGTFVNPPGYSLFSGMIWAGGGSGGTGDPSGGGAGGMCLPFSVSPTIVGTNQPVVIGAGGAAVSAANTAGNTGGNSLLISAVTAFGGGGGVNNGGNINRTNSGGGSTGAGSSAQEPFGIGGGNSSIYLGAGLLGGAGATRNSDWGGAAGANTAASGNSVFGGAAGGGSSSTYGEWQGGASRFGGSGGAGSPSGSAVSGVAPAGGGGASRGGTSGAGGGGELRIWGSI